MDINRLKALRNSLSLSQKDVANALGYSQQRYQCYESGKNEPDNITLMRISEYFKVSTDYLLGITDDPTPSSEKKEAPAVSTAEALRIFAEGKKGSPLTQEELNRLRDFVETYIKGLNK